MFTRILLYITILLLGCVLGANIYNSVVDAPNWGSAIPASLDAAKQYFAVADPGSFYRVASPAAQVAGLLSIIFGWRLGGRMRILTALALALAVLGDVMTFTYFYPRNAIMFGANVFSNEELTNAWTGWTFMNHIRSAIVLAAVLCELAALSHFERRTVARWSAY
jgi:hypothetical protein